MALFNAPEINSVGPNGGYGMPMMGGFAGGYGGGGLVEGLVLASLLGRGGIGNNCNDHGHMPHNYNYNGGGGHGHDCLKDMFILKAVGDNKDTIVNEGRGLAAAIASSKDVNVAQFAALAGEICDTRFDLSKSVSDVGMALSKEICDIRGDVKDSTYALTLQNITNTQGIKDQALAFQIANDRKFDELSREGERNTAIILAKLNQTELDHLRDELHGSRRRFADREIEINIQNTAIAQQQQQQAQFANQRHDFDRKFDVLFSQVAKSNQDIINVGGLMAGVAQSANPVNVKS